MTKLTRILSLTLLTATLCHAAWDKNDDSLAYQLDGMDVWRLNYSQTNDTKPHFSILGPVAGPNLVCTKPKELKAGESFSLRYRIYVHKGRWNAEKLKKLPQ